MRGFFLPGSEEKPTEHYPNILKSHHLQVVTTQKGALTSFTISRHCYFTQSLVHFFLNPCVDLSIPSPNYLEPAFSLAKTSV